MKGKPVFEASVGLVALIPAEALAAGAATPGLGELGLRAGLALGAVLGLIVLLAVLVRRLRLSPGLAGGGGRLSSIARLDLGARREVRLVAVEGRHLVLGVTSERIELLADYPAEREPDSEAADPDPAVPFVRELTRSL